jgi:hypothetical protein
MAIWRVSIVLAAMASSAAFGQSDDETVRAALKSQGAFECSIISALGGGGGEERRLELLELGRKYGAQYLAGKASLGKEATYDVPVAYWAQDDDLPNEEFKLGAIYNQVTRPLGEKIFLDGVKLGNSDQVAAKLYAERNCAFIE